MSAIPSFTFQSMDSSHLDDTMDVASSPFRQPDDLDVELDSVREPSIIESLQDDMVDDAIELAETRSDIMQDQVEDTLPDDDMIDDENTTNLEIRDEDFNMDTFADEPRVDEDEDILYEEDEDIEYAAEKAGEQVQFNTEQENEKYQEAEVEVILDDVEEQPYGQESHSLATNDLEAETRATAPENSDDAGQAPTNADFTTTESLAEAVVESEAQDGGNNSSEQEEAAQDNLTGISADQSHEAQLDESYAHPKNVEQVVENAEALDETEIHDPQEHEITGELQRQETGQSAEGQKDISKGVHPVTLVYLDEEMSLFPPMIGDESSVYFLADSSLAFEPLDKLLAACREILAGTLDHDDELVLDIPSLGLHICEDSKHAAQISLSQILDVYLQLCRNDEGQEVHPLYCHLSSRVSLASQYAYLVSSCNEGRTFSEIAADHIDTPEPEPEHTESANYQEAEEDYSNQEVPGEGHSADVPSEPLSAAKPEVDPQSDQAATEQADAGGNVAGLSDQAIETTAADGLPQEPAEQISHSELSIVQETEKAITDAEVHPFEDNQTEDHAQPHESASGEQEAYADVLDHSEAQEHETNSSHTVEAEIAENQTLEAAADEVGSGIDGSFDDPLEQVEDLFEHHEEAEQADDDDLDSYSDEELFAHEEVDQEEVTNAMAPADDGTIASTEQTLDEQEQELNQYDDEVFTSADRDVKSAPNGHDASMSVVPESGSLASPPMTPSNTNHAKRKVVDDDELDLLDLDTPEPKRRRPS